MGEDHCLYDGTDLDDISSTGSPKLTEWQDDPLYQPMSPITVGVSADDAKLITFIDLEILARKVSNRWQEEDGPGYYITDYEFLGGLFPCSVFGSGTDITNTYIYVTKNAVTPTGLIAARILKYSIKGIISRTRGENLIFEEDDDIGSGPSQQSGWQGITGYFGKKAVLYPAFRGLTADVGEVDCALEFKELCLDVAIQNPNMFREPFELCSERAQQFEIRSWNKIFGGAAFTTTYSGVPLLGITVWTEFMTQDALRRQSIESLMAAQLEGTLKSRTTFCAPVRVHEELFKHIANGQVKDLIGTEAKYSRLLMSTHATSSYDFGLAIDTYMLEPIIFTPTLIGLMTAIWSLEQFANRPNIGSLFYYPTYTSRVNLLTSLINSNTELAASDFKSSYIFASPCPPYYAINKNDGSMLFIYYSQDREDIIVNSQGNFPDENTVDNNVVVNFNDCVVEEFVHMDFCLMCRAKWDYGNYEYSEDFGCWRPPGEPTNTLFALNLEFYPPDSSAGRRVEVSKDIYVEIGSSSRLPPNIGQPEHGLFNKLRWFPPITGDKIPSADIFSEDPEWKYIGNLGAEAILAKATSDGAVEHSVMSGWYLRGITMQYNAFDSVLENITYKALGLGIPSTRERDLDAQPSAVIDIDLYALVVGQPEHGSFYYHKNQGSCFQDVRYLPGLMSFPQLIYHDDGRYNPSRWQIENWTLEDGGNQLTQMAIYKIKYRVDYSVQMSRDLLEDDTQIVAIIKLPYGYQSGAHAAVIYNIASSEGVKTKASSLSLTSLTMKPLSISFVTSVACAQWVRPQLHFDQINQYLTTYTTDGLIRINLKTTLSAPTEGSVQLYPWPKPVCIITNLDEIVEYLTLENGPDWSGGRAW